jgi:hypothetical protein
MRVGVGSEVAVREIAGMCVRKMACHYSSLEGRHYGTNISDRSIRGRESWRGRKH